MTEQSKENTNDEPIWLMRLRNWSR